MTGGEAMTVDPNDLGILLLHSLRYSMGRRSTAPGTTCDLIRRYWKQTDEPHRKLLLRDLREEIERDARMRDDVHRTNAHAAYISILGDPCDVRTWQALLTWMLERT